MRPSNSFIVTPHAIDRFQDRVAAVDRPLAVAAIEGIAMEGRRRARPRHWMRDSADMESGVSFIYDHRLPDICLLMQGNTVVTVYSRAVCSRWRREDGAGYRRQQRNHRRLGARRKFDSRNQIDSSRRQISSNSRKDT